MQYRGRKVFPTCHCRRRPFKDATWSIALQTIGHETTIWKSADPRDRADHALLRQALHGQRQTGRAGCKAVLRAAKGQRLKWRTDATLMQPAAQVYGENEVVADVSGAMALDAEFWERLTTWTDRRLNAGSPYKFMEKATKLRQSREGLAAGQRTFINNIEQVREVAAQDMGAQGQARRIRCSAATPRSAKPGR